VVSLAYSIGVEMKKKIVWLIPIVYHTNKVNARSRFIQGRITKVKKTGKAGI